MTPDGILTANGVTSVLRSEDWGVLGHVLLLDFDGGVPFERVIRDVSDLPGPSLVFESSPGSYHVHNPVLRSIDETALSALSTKCDPMHVSVGYRRGEWTLRVGPKDRVNASAGSEDLPERYREAPEYRVEVVNRSGDAELSGPHLALALGMIGRDDPDAMDRIADAVDDRCPGPRVGGRMKPERYLTLTDDLKS